jgi:hypothetical protein
VRQANLNQKGLGLGATNRFQFESCSVAFRKELIFRSVTDLPPRD